MTRLLVVADSLGGGLGAAAAQQRAWFLARGWSVVVAAPDDEEAAAANVPFEPIPLPPTTRDALAIGRTSRAIARLARVFQPDVVHCHGPRSFMATRLGTTRRPWLTMHGTGAVPSDPAGYGAVRRAGLALLPTVAAGAFSATPEPRRGWRFLPHASPQLAHLDRLPFPAPSSTPVFLWLGRLEEQKQPGVFVDAVAAVARERDIVGIVAGGGALLPDVLERVRRTNAPVEVLGQTSDVASLLSQAWAVCLFSRFEALTFALQEALWVGRPAIGSQLPGLEWLVGDAGRLVGDAAGAADAMRELCDHATAAALGALGAKRIRSLIDPVGPWAAVEDAYAGR